MMCWETDKQLRWWMRGKTKGEILTMKQEDKTSDRYWLITGGEIRALTTYVVPWLAESAVRTVGCHAGDKKRNNSA